MPEVQRSSDVIETHAEHALEYGIGGLVALVLGGVMIYYQGMLMYLGFLLALGGLGAIGFAIYCVNEIKKVPVFKLPCPFCKHENKLTEAPKKDVSCVECHRLIPIENGQAMQVFQVRCGFCNRLNFYSAKSVGLLCEECDREIPLAVGDGSQLPTKSFSHFARHDDDKVYDLILVASGHKTEELINCLQHMLALNRNQVKQMLTELPVTLLTGVPKRKAEMLHAQIAVHEGAAEVIETRSATA